MNIDKIAKELYENNVPVSMIYAFNGVGKTRLSIAYKDYTKKQNKGNHSGVYYNAYSEDLFKWDNEEFKLEIVQSSLNNFHSYIMDDEERLREKLQLYFPKYDFDFNPYDDRENGIESISFFKETDEDKSPIKISRGEESIFIWCFFLALFETEDFESEQGEHFYIDDPVSSLDDYNVYTTVNSIIDMIKNNVKVKNKKRLIISTHHIGLFSILGNRIQKIEFKDQENFIKFYVLDNQNGEMNLNPPNLPFLFHLHLLKTLNDAIIENKVYEYHMVLLRQLLENISSFLGKSHFSYCLNQIEIKNTNNASALINSASHKDAFQLRTSIMPPEELKIFKEIIEGIKKKYHFKF